MSTHEVAAGAAPVRRTRSPFMAIVGWQYRTTVRARWVLGMGGVFAVLCLTVTILAFRTVRDVGLAGIGPASATLVNLGVLLPSLIGLLLGAGALVGAREQGLLAMMAAQPVRRSSIVTATFLGLTGALWTTIALGYGAALLVMSGVARGSDVPALGVLIGCTFALGAASVAIGVAISAVATTRAQAVAAGVGIWIVFSLGVDLALAALAPSIHLGPRALLAAVLLNPFEAARILALLGTNLQGTALGPFGAYLLTTFGTVGAVAVLAVDLALWVILPVAVARWALAGRDL
jgi:ABC-type transport system involved in multi-copper enzyme maturation permease subunit